MRENGGSDMSKPQTQRNMEAGKIIGDQIMPILDETWHMPAFKFKR